MKKTIDLRKERERQRYEDYKKCILHAAEAVILRKGYSAVTMDDIAREAQFSKATLYNCFHGKAELIEEILLHYYDDMKEILEAILVTDGSATDKLKKAILSILEYYDKKENMSRALLMDDTLRGLFHNFAGGQAGVSSRRQGFILRLKTKSRDVMDIGGKLFREGVENGEFREMDIEAAVYFVNAVLEGILHLRAWTGQKLQTSKEAEMIFEFLWEGFAGHGRSRIGEPS